MTDWPFSSMGLIYVVECVKVSYYDFGKCSSEKVEQLGCLGSGDFMVSLEFQVTWESYSEVFDTPFCRYWDETICERRFSAKGYVYAF